MAVARRKFAGFMLVQGWDPYSPRTIVGYHGGLSGVHTDEVRSLHDGEYLIVDQIREARPQPNESTSTDDGPATMPTIPPGVH